MIAGLMVMMGGVERVVREKDSLPVHYIYAE